MEHLHNCARKEEGEERKESEYSFYCTGRRENLLKTGILHESLPLFGYNYESKRWVEQKFSEKEAVPQVIENFVVATQNIWFGEYQFHRRYKEQMDTFSNELPHIVCLQEVIYNFTHQFKKHEGMMKNYVISDDPLGPQSFMRYGSMLLIRKDLLPSVMKVGKLVLPSGMARSLIHCDLLLKDKNGSSFIVNIGSIHLESLRNPIYRRSQLRLISDHVQSKFEHAILCGDFNFPCRRNYYENTKPLENDFFKSEDAKDLRNYKDVWSELKYDSIDPEKDMPGYTKDSQRNQMLANMGKNQAFRYDRIFLKSKKYVPNDVKLINDHEIQGTVKKTFPSDHFGVQAVLKLE